MEFKYSVETDAQNGGKFANVEQVGRVPLNDNESVEKRVKGAVVALLNLNEKDVEVKKVDELNVGPVTSKKTTNK